MYNSKNCPGSYPGPPLQRVGKGMGGKWGGEERGVGLGKGEGGGKWEGVGLDEGTGKWGRGGKGLCVLINIPYGYGSKWRHSEMLVYEIQWTIYVRTAGRRWYVFNAFDEWWVSSCGIYTTKYRWRERAVTEHPRRSPARRHICERVRRMRRISANY